MGIQVLLTLQLPHSKITIYDTTLCKMLVLHNKINLKMIIIHSTLVSWLSIW